MGTSSSVDEFVAKQMRAAAELAKMDNANNRPLMQAAREAKRIHTAFMARAIGGDLRMGKRRIGIKYDAVSAGVLIKATGPAHLIERDTSAHWIAPKSKRGGRTRKGNANRLGGMAFVDALTGGGGRIGAGLGRGRTGIKMPPNDTGFSMYARHPGTTGKHPFERGQRAVIQATGPKLAKAITAELARVYG